MSLPVFASPSSGALTRAETSITEVPTTIQTATSNAVVTPSASGNGNVPTRIIVTSVVTREGPTSGTTGPALTTEIVAITVDAQPSECSSRWALAFPAGSTIITSGNYQGTVFNDTVAPGYWRTCYPNAPEGTEMPIYSPAMCTGHRSVTNIISAVNSAGPSPTTVWSAMCCPSGMTYFGRCQSTLTAPFTVLAPITTATLWNPGPIFSFLTVWDTTVDYILYRSQTALSTGTLFAEPVTIMWQSSDLSKFPISYATALAASMGVQFQETYQADFRAESSTGSGARLSVGAKVGIAIGTVLGFALLTGAAVILCLRRHRKAKQPLVPEDRMEPVLEVSGYSSGLRRLFQGRWRAEIDGRTQRIEMETEKVFELPVPPAELAAPQHQQTEDIVPPYDIRPHLESAGHKKEGTVSISEVVKNVSD